MRSTTSIPAAWRRSLTTPSIWSDTRPSTKSRSWRTRPGAACMAWDAGARTAAATPAATADWNQEWRAPLRQALDWLRDEVAPCYEQTRRALLQGSLGRAQRLYPRRSGSLAGKPGTFSATAISAARMYSERDRVKVWKLLEMQRHAMLMYTSCGWFFDELSGIETVQVIQYAGRVVQLAEELFGAAIEQRFLEKLALAKSNVPAAFRRRRDLQKIRQTCHGGSAETRRALRHEFSFRRLFRQRRGSIATR